MEVTLNVYRFLNILYLIFPALISINNLSPFEGERVINVFQPLGFGLRGQWVDLAWLPGGDGGGAWLPVLQIVVANYR